MHAKQRSDGVLVKMSAIKEVWKKHDKRVVNVRIRGRANKN